MPGRELPPTSRFAADDGAPDPALAAALARRAAGQGSLEDVVAALARARVLVPVLAVEHEDGPEHEDGAEREVPTAGPGAADACRTGDVAESRHASAGVVAVAAPDGRTALPVFTSVAALAAWHPTARPMPAEGPRAAAAALGEGWDLMVVDPGGGAPAVIPRPAVHALAGGTPWQPAVRAGAVVPTVREAVRRAAEGPGVLAVDVVPGRRAEVGVVLTLAPGLSRSGLARTLDEVGARLAGDGEVTAAVDSLELRPVAATDDADADADAPAASGVSDAVAAAPAPTRGRRWRRAPGRR
ncbi:SseB family protein [Actinotalea fermentans]|uniref:SseB protein N-terminal domain-containing protein n=1 Tax=Actinotalea fermentans TaxID=43671 RepID=A0A511YVI3_9CELL|nr:SseB family protein [Actinotalea fermentans]GEN79214.1 hypothetical protein AFE02nite_09480 [Actinotalea fermentans]